MLLPNLLAGTIKLYSSKAMPQLIKIVVNKPAFFKKLISLKRKCPYQATVINVFDAINNNMVLNARGISVFFFKAERIGSLIRKL